jgi:hydrogenase expression/formation protein HypC
MCIGIPMQVVRADEMTADCMGRGRSERLSTLLTGPLAAGTWVLAYQGSALRMLTESEAHATDAALDALEAAIDGAADIDRFFADLVSREPTLPPHLKEPQR